MNTHTLRTLAGASRSAVSGAATALLLLAGAGTAQAAGWTWSLTPYAWATDVGVAADLNEREIVDETIPVSDLLKDLNTIFQMRLEAQSGQFGVMVDLFDVTLEDEVSGVELPQGMGQAAMQSDIGMTIFDVAGTFDPQGDRQGVSLLLGARILNERATVDATFEPAAGGSIAKAYETNETLVDGMIGMRFTKRFAQRWGYQMQADVSTGGTDYTWSVGPSLSYALSRRYALSAGYRHMTVDYQDEGGLDTRMTLSGVLIGFRTSF